MQNAIKIKQENGNTYKNQYNRQGINANNYAENRTDGTFSRLASAEQANLPLMVSNSKQKMYHEHTVTGGV